MSPLDLVAQFEYLVYELSEEHWGVGYLFLYAAAEHYNGRGDFGHFARRWIAQNVKKNRLIEAGYKAAKRNGRVVLVRRTVTATEHCWRNATYASPTLAQVMRRTDHKDIDLSPLSGLTRDVAELSARGLGTGQVAESLGITPSNVFHHRKRAAQALALRPLGGKVCWAGRGKRMRGRAPRGESNGQAKLSAADVHKIREALATGPRGTARRLAREYGVGESVISSIKHGRSWGYGPNQRRHRPMWVG